MSAPGVADPGLAEILRSVERSLSRRFPDVAPDVIQAAIAEAVRACAGARVQNFLSILIERRAADALSALPPPNTEEPSDASTEHLVDHDRRGALPAPV